MSSLTVKEGDMYHLATKCDGCGREEKGNPPLGWMSTFAVPLHVPSGAIRMGDAERHICPKCYGEGKQ